MQKKKGGNEEIRILTTNTIGTVGLTCTCRRPFPHGPAGKRVCGYGANCFTVSTAKGRQGRVETPALAKMCVFQMKIIPPKRNQIKGKERLEFWLSGDETLC